MIVDESDRNESSRPAVANSCVADLTVLGAYPPPFGGVTIHTLRLLNQFHKRGLAMRVYNLNSDSECAPDVISLKGSRLRGTLKVVFSRNDPNILVMNRRVSVWIIVTLLGWLTGKRVLIRLQGADVVDWSQDRGIKWLFARFCMLSCSGWVCVNQHLAEALKGAGVPPEKILVMPGYLPPSASELNSAETDDDLKEFLERSHPSLAANGKVAEYRGQDLYGLDLLVRMTAELIDQFPAIGLVLCLDVVDESDREKITELKRLADSLAVSEHIFFDLESGFFVPTLQKCDVFVRPTNTDGDANSIREALALRKRVVASDVVERPAGTVLHRNRDLRSLTETVGQVLAQQGTEMAESFQTMANDPTIEEYIDFICGRGCTVD